MPTFDNAGFSYNEIPKKHYTYDAPRKYGQEELKEEFKQTNIRDLVDKAPSGQAIYDKCMEIATMLLKKNIAYGNSALEPIRVFSTASTSEQLLVRIDDKLNRIKNGVEYQDEDAIDDLIGYLILLKVQYAKESEMPHKEA